MTTQSTSTTAQHRPRFLLSALASAALLTCLQAQAESLPEVKVQATSTPAAELTQPNIEQAQQTVRQTPGGASVVDSESFRDGRVSTLSDALGYTTGVFIQPRFGAEEARLSIRGSGLQRTFHGRGVRVTQDGIPVNLADGSFDFQALEALSTQHIDVFRGANAFGLGSATLGGAINYVSETGATAPRFGARVEMGSFGYLRSAVQVATKQENWDAYALLSQFRQDGFRDHSKQEGDKFIGNVGITINPDVATRFFVASVRSNSELPGSLTLAQALSYPEQANPANFAAHQRRDLNLDRLSNRTVIKTGTGAVTVNTYVSAKHLFHPIFEVIEQDNRDWGAQVQWSVDHTLAGLPSETTVGVGYSKGITDNLNRQNVGGQPVGAARDKSRQTADNQDYFLENRTTVLPGLQTVAGLQLQQAMRQYSGFNVGATPQQFFFRKDYDQLSPRLGLIKTFADNSQIYGNYSGSFEPPSFGELGVSGGTAAFTTNNRAQEAQSVELGYRGRNSNWVWDTTVYYAQIQDELMATVIPGTALSSTFNAPNTTRAGLELGWSYTTGPWTVRNSTLINHFRFDSDPDFGNNRIAGAPSAATRIALDRKLDYGIKATVAVEAATSTWVDHKNTATAPGYGIVNAKLSGPLNPQTDWFVDARNLDDKPYIATTGVVRQFAAGSAQFLPGDGRSVFVGVNYRMK
ncbi:MAG: TonB-dependent receptor family protein [Limnobacter sp.]|uniref:TonB-dependent receptor family protein n=1 Tax=Limnobacter sp. TaxID=2003368 RepID=UPI0039197D38